MWEILRIFAPFYKRPKNHPLLYMSKEDNPIRVYGRSELAQLYYGRPVSDSAARRWFMLEISKYDGLMEKLIELGFKKTGHSFSRDQIREIFARMGPPPA